MNVKSFSLFFDWSRICLTNPLIWLVFWSTSGVFAKVVQDNATPPIAINKTFLNFFMLAV